MFIDSQNKLWIGSSKGVYRESLKLPLFKNKNLPFIAKTIEKHNNALYVGGRKGLQKINGDNTLEPIHETHVLGLREFESYLYATNVQGELFKIKNDSVHKKSFIKRI